MAARAGLVDEAFPDWSRQTGIRVRVGQPAIARSCRRNDLDERGRTSAVHDRPVRPPSQTAPRTANQSGAIGASRRISFTPSEPASATCTPASASSHRIRRQSPTVGASREVSSRP